MNSAERVVDACAQSGLVCHPGERPGITDILGVTGAALGFGDTPAGRASLPATDRAVVVLIDGLGYHNLAERGGHAPFLRRLVRDSEGVSTTFPSTTATALASFGTGAWPGQTGMLGYTVRNPYTGGLGNLVSWTGMPEPRQWQTQDTWFERFARAGMAVSSVGPHRFQGSGLTEAALRGATYVPASSLSDRVDATIALLRRPGLVYLYWGEVDKIGHHQGWSSLDWGDAVSTVDSELHRLARSLPTGALMVVTADHGMVDVDPSLQWDVAHIPALGQGVALVSGEKRALQLHLEPDTQPEDVAERWRDVLGSHAMVLTKQDVVESGLFGPVLPEILPTIGGVVVAMAGRAAVIDSATQTPGSMALIGVHGSLTSMESVIPMLVIEG